MGWDTERQKQTVGGTVCGHRELRPRVDMWRQKKPVFRKKAEMRAYPEVVKRESCGK